MLTKMNKFLRRRRGSILIEAAIAFPVLIAILLGMVEFGVAFTVKRRNAQIASTAADLVAQGSTITGADLQSIATIGATILAPYPHSSSIAGLRITSVMQNANGATVAWSCGYGSLSAYSLGSTYALSANLVSQNQAAIVAEASYNFTPVIGSFLGSAITFSAKAYNMPRLSASVAKQGSC